MKVVFEARKMWKLCGNYVEIIFSAFFPREFPHNCGGFLGDTLWYYFLSMWSN